MSESTKIAWCDSTINFYEGCTKVSEGCRFCYAEARDKRFNGSFSTTPTSGIHWGAGRPRRKSKSAVKDALKYNRKPWICDQTGESFSEDGVTQYAQGFNAATFHRRRIFSLSLGDWLDNEVPIEWLCEMLDTIRQCDQVTWILCSKRPHLFHSRLEAAQDYDFDHGKRELCGWLRDWRIRDSVPRNIILLASVENQEQADKRIPELLKIPAACRGLSLEPLLGPVDISHWCVGGGEGGIDWEILGGESGNNARPCNVDWIRSLVQQGQAAGVPVFVKQLGSTPVFEPIAIQNPEFDYTHVCNISRLPIANLLDKKGGDINEWPEDLRVQQWPKGF